MNDPLLIRAAELLEALALDLTDTHTVGGVWNLEDEFCRLAHAEQCELLDIAAKLRERERRDTLAHNLSGGVHRP